MSYTCKFTTTLFTIKTVIYEVINDDSMAVLLNKWQSKINPLIQMFKLFTYIK